MKLLIITELLLYTDIEAHGNSAVSVTDGICQSLQEVVDAPVVESMYIYCSSWIWGKTTKTFTVYPNSDGTVKTGCTNGEGWTEASNYKICLEYASLGGNGTDISTTYGDVTFRHSNGTTNTLRITKTGTLYAKDIAVPITQWK